MNQIIRRMQAQDIAAVAALERESFIDPWPQKAFEDALQQQKFMLPLVVERDGQISAYAIVVFVVDEVHINNIAVAAKFRRQGIAERLLQYIFDIFPDHQVAFLEVRKSNKAAINLYRKFNFKVIDERRNYYSDGENALVMQRVVNLI